MEINGIHVTFFGYNDMRQESATFAKDGDEWKTIEPSMPLLQSRIKFEQIIREMAYWSTMKIYRVHVAFFHLKNAAVLSVDDTDMTIIEHMDSTNGMNVSSRIEGITLCPEGFTTSTTQDAFNEVYRRLLDDTCKKKPRRQIIKKCKEMLF